MSPEERLRHTLEENASRLTHLSAPLLLMQAFCPVTSEEWERFAGPGDRTQWELNELLENRLKGALAGALAVSDSSLGDLEKLLQQALLEARSLQEAPNIGLQPRGTGEADLCIRVKRRSRGTQYTDECRQALPLLLAELLWDFTRQRGEAVEPRDSQGRTASQFLAELFETERCAECGGDVADHTPEMVLGNWFARCKTASVEETHD